MRVPRSSPGPRPKPSASAAREPLTEASPRLATPSAAPPVDAIELGAIFAPVTDALGRADNGHRRVSLAVSGGADSMALMLLAKRWADACPPDARPDLDVVTIDHGLRPDSAAEAGVVERAAGALGLSHSTLDWGGPKPSTGVMAAAREARLGLLLFHARSTGARVVVLAHTVEDQAETVLMRLARGTGIDGLGAMSPVVVREQTAIVRPLLTVSRARLIATLVEAGLGWIDDPSNEDPRFERVRVREQAPALHQLGLSPYMLSVTAERARRATDALEAATWKVIADRGVLTMPTFGDQLVGMVQIDWDRLRNEPEEIVIRVMMAVIGAVGGTKDRDLLSKVEAITHRSARPPARTVARVRLHPRRDGTLDIVREQRRARLPRLAIEPGERHLWDDRFMVELADTAREDVAIIALGEALEINGPLDFELPADTHEALMTVPAVVQRGRIVAVPTCGFGPPELYSCSWMGLCRPGQRPPVSGLRPGSPRNHR